MSFFRPEAKAALWRWRQAGLGLALAALGLYGALSSLGALRLVSYAALAAGLALLWEGWRRARLPRDGGGAGVVEVDERQVTYFAASGGGALSLDSLSRVEISASRTGPNDDSGAPALCWHLAGTDGPPLAIPSNAVGAEALYDALTALPGVDLDQAIAAKAATRPARFVIWTRTKSHRRLS